MVPFIQQMKRQLRFGLKLAFERHPGLSTALRIVGSLFGEIQLHPQRSRHRRIGIGGGVGHLAIGAFAHRARVLVGYTHRAVPLMHKIGGTYDQCPIAHMDRIAHVRHPLPIDSGLTHPISGQQLLQSLGIGARKDRGDGVVIFTRQSQQKPRAVALQILPHFLTQKVMRKRGKKGLQLRQRFYRCFLNHGYTFCLTERSHILSTINRMVLCKQIVHYIT